MTYTVTDEQLQKIIRESIEKIIDLNVVPAEENKQPINTNATQSDNNINEFSAEEYRIAIKTMAANRGKGNEPKVGIFWCNTIRKELFGVVSHKISDYTRANAGSGLITCSEMHEDVWKRNFRKQKYHGDGTGPYVGQYQDKPRGRVFYNPASDKFIIAVGKWFNDCPEIKQFIIEEFDLPADKTLVQYGEHWDIGQTWAGTDFPE